jgi:hypothetical protein
MITCRLIFRESCKNREAWLKNYFMLASHGDTGIVIGALEAKGSGVRFDIERDTWVADPNASFSDRLRFTGVYIRRDGKWLLAALQNAVPLSVAKK